MKDKFFSEVRNASKTLSHIYPRAASCMPDDLYTEVFTLYEMLRISDIIEESKSDNKGLMLDAHVESLNNEKKSDEVKDFVSKNTLGTKKIQEISALKYYDMFFDIYITLPRDAKDIIAETTKRMVPGMKDDSFLDVRTFDDQKKYAGHVAGEPGLGLTRLFDIRLGFSNSGVMFERGYNHGIALQKVNILRGIKEDITAGRHYVPQNLLDEYGLDRTSFPNNGLSHEVIKTLAKDAQDYLNYGLEYLLDIPMTIRYPEYEYSKGIRTFMTGLVLLGQEMSYNIYKKPSLVLKGDYKPINLLLKHAYLSRHLWDDNKKIKKIFENKKI